MPILGDVSAVEPARQQFAVETDRLTKRYGERAVVDELSFKVPSASVAAFVGPNGAGKSTTFRMLLGLVRPTSGSGRVLKGNIASPASYLSSVGALIEGPAFYPGLSGFENLRVLAALSGIDDRRIHEALEIVGLDKRAGDPASKYSLGMKQRLGVAAALLPEPQLLVLDEPTNGLDPTGIASMRVLLRSVADSGISVLVSSHQLSELQQIADWVTIINQGRLMFEGRLDDLLSRTTSTVVKPEREEDLARLAEVIEKNGFAIRSRRDGQLLLDLPSGNASELSRIAMKEGIVLDELRSGQASLEEIYFDLTDGRSSIV